jgi:hypothetical protein
MNYENEIEEELIPCDGDYVMFDSGYLGSRTSVSIVNGRFIGEFHTREDAEHRILARMKEDSFFPNVFYQDDHGGITPVSIQYNLWADPTLSMGDKYRVAYDRLVEKGYVISINESLPTIAIDRYITYDGKIHREDIFFAQGQDAQELLDEVPDDIYRDHFILFEIAG